MREADRKVAWGGVIVLTVIAAALLWLLFIGPADNHPNYTATCEKDCSEPWWQSVGVWTMIFTGVLTGSTILLWLETRRLAEGADAQAADTKQSLVIAKQAADAASKQASASLGAELPRLIVTAISPSGFQPGNILANFGPAVTFINHGRTAPIIIGDGIEVMVAANLPAEPEYQRQNMRRTPLATIIETGDRWTVDFRNRTRVAISSSEVAEIILGVKTLWVYGFVRYRDFLSESHVQGFCARLQVNHVIGSENDPEMIGLEFVEGGPPAYSYDKYATKKPT